MLDLVVARQRLGAVPEPRAGPAGPRGRSTAAHEPLAPRVLLHLEVQPGQPEDRPLESASAAPAGRGSGPQIRSTSGHQVPPDLVHDVVAEPLQQAHHRLGLAEEPPLLVGHEALQPVLAVASPRRARPRPRSASRPERRRRAARTPPAAAPGDRPGRAGARGAPRTRRRGSSRGGRSRSGTAPSGTPSARAVAGCSPRRRGAGRAPPRPTAARGRTGRGRAGP